MEDDGFFPIRKPTDEEGYAVLVEKDRERFLFGREGDHLLTMFQCDLCHYRNILKTSPGNDARSLLLMKVIRRANLDALWSREPGTVRNTSREIRNMGKKAALLGLDINDMLPPMGPFPMSDIHGMGLAVCMLMRSLDSGKNEITIQFSTTQKMKSAYANVWRASLNGSQSAVVVRDTAKMFVTTSPSHGEWFERFCKGMHERMGDKIRQDLGITIEQMLSLSKRYEDRWVLAGTDRKAQERVLFPALFAVISFVCALRGEETPMMSLAGTRNHIATGLRHPSMPHVVVALLGRFKTEVGEQYHLMPVVPITASGLNPGLWIVRMVQWYTDGGETRGWVFRNKDGGRARASDYEWDILNELDNIQREEVDVVGDGINVFEEFGVNRSFRRGSDAHAINCGVPPIVIELNNRWRSVEHAKGRAPRLRMIHHYADVRHMLKSLLQYSKPL